MVKKIRKFKKTLKKRFIIAIDEEIEKNVNDALGMVEMGLIDKGAAIIEGLMKHHPNYHTVHYGMGVVHAFRKQYDEAIKCFKKALGIFPCFTDAQFNIAVSYQEKLDFGNAIRAYQKVVEIGNKDDELVKMAEKFLSEMEENVRKDKGIGLDEYVKGMDIFEKACGYMEELKWEKAIESL